MVWFLLQIFFSLNWSQQKWSWNGSKLGQLLSWITSSPQKSIWRFSEIGVTPKSAILDWDFPLSTNHLGGFPIYGNPKHGFPKMGGPPIFSINWVSSHKASIFSDTSIYGHPNKTSQNHATLGSAMTFTRPISSRTRRTKRMESRCGVAGGWRFFQASWVEAWRCFSRSILSRN